jgi:adenine deaminase
VTNFSEAPGASKSPAELLAVARGDEPADLVLRGGRLVNVLSGEIQETAVAIHGGLIAGLGGYEEGRETVDLDHAYLAPSYIEGHMHVETTLLTPHELARAACARGTGTLVCDPHEIANVLGVRGIEWMLGAGEGAPAELLYTAPSCVPVSAMETAGSAIGEAEVAALLEDERVVGLAEVMNFPGAVAGDAGVLGKLGAAKGYPVDGHAPGLSGRALNAYVAAGPGSEHEATALEEGREKLRLGMRVMMREGTPAKDLRALLPLVTPSTERRLLMVNDDVSVADLMDRGHLDHHLRLAVAAGVDPITALRMVTLNVAEWFELEDRGAIAPGLRADLVVLRDLEGFETLRTYQAGRLVAREGRCLREYRLPPGLGPTVRVDWDAVDLSLPVHGKRARVIGVVPGQVLTRALLETPSAEDGLAVADPSRDLLKLAVVERHTGHSTTAVALVRGLGLERGALASSVAHDHHNVMLTGTDDADMLLAGREVGRLGGGFVVAAEGEVLASVALPIAGLMSPAPFAEVRTRYDRVLEAARSLGCHLDDPFMTLSFLGLCVIPELKLTDKGLVDVARFELVSPFE